MKKIMLILLLFVSITSCNQKTNSSVDETDIIDKLINEWHMDATTGKLDSYFNKMTDDAYFIGTDASEKWVASEFKVFCEPHFADGSGWDFKTIKREIYLNDNKDFAWFDEQLDTWMGVCMSSGVLIKTKDGWKIKHYQLSVAIPNDLINDFIKLVESGKTELTKDNN